MTSRTVLTLILCSTVAACEGYEYPNFGSVTPNTVDTDTGQEALDIEGQPWLYTGTIPGEEEAGVTCTEDECERCVLLQDGAISISFRPIGGTAQDWTTVQYGSYTSSGSSYVVDLRWNWSAVSADGLANANEGYIVISEAQGAASDYTTLGIGVCPE